MNVRANCFTFCLAFMAFVLSFLMTTTAFAQSSENQQITVEGSLTDDNGNAIDLAGKNLTFYVSANNCYLYGETTTSAGDSTGNIYHRIGSSTLVSGSPNGFTQNLFFGSVSGTTNFLGNSCSVTAADTRLVQVYFSEQNITTTIKLGTVPYAHNATMLNGKNAADFVQVSTDTNTLLFSGSPGQVLIRSASGTLIWHTPAATTVTASAITSALGYTPVSSTASVTSATVNSAYGYTPANSATVTSQINSVSSTVTSLKNSTAASFAAIVSSQWTTSGANIHFTTGKVGVGTTTPRTALDVSGTIVGSPASANASTVVDYSKGNIQYTTGNCQAFQLHNLKDGAAYTFVVQGATAALCSFSAYSDNGSTALTVHLPPDHEPTTAAKHTIYSFFVAGSHVYFSWLPEM